MFNEGKIDLSVGRGSCKDLQKCRTWEETFGRRMLGNYVATDKSSAKLTPAVIPVKSYNAESYFGTAKKVHKGAAFRQARKSDREGFTCELFEWSNFIPDIHEINTSMDTRSGGVMKSAYQRSIEELGGAPTQFKATTPIKCPMHHTFNWGIFAIKPDYTQGTIKTGKKLLGYIKFKRNGNLATYTTILGHGDYLQYGIMYRLHYKIMEWLYSSTFFIENPIDYILYGSIDSGTEGLKLWKKRCLFIPKSLCLA